MKLLTRQVLRQTLFIIVIAAVLGLVSNIFHPHHVKITFSRPPIEFAEDDSLAQLLPSINIGKENNIEELDGPISISKEVIVKLLNTNSALLIDSRSQEEYEKEHIPGAISLAYNSVLENKKQINKLPRNKWLITYCDGAPCDVAELLAYEIMYAGFKKVAIYPDGLNGWKNGNKR